MEQSKNYSPVSEEIRKMCWNQGDWRFYKYYRQWQWKTYPDGLFGGGWFEDEAFHEAEELLEYLEVEA